jgi:hypothetical protein
MIDWTIPLQWAGMVASVSSAFLVAEKKFKLGFWGFLVADGLLIPVSIQAHLWGLTSLYIIYAGINIRGIWNIRGSKISLEN